ncbi:hypothetical protein Vadar_003753 [Vaccinium darrowii]|uniref:Uncharacterized protein n=1 Tax=Vaccinium darrowii TaxID=229202 RepID=A0ACB7XXY6_9ERIC|nr:hypothetical protein Vadar_003753 [Vaccinium darrowii]
MVLLGKSNGLEFVWPSYIPIWRLEESVKLTDGIQSMPIKKLLEDQFGYQHDFLGISVVAVVGFCLLFAVTFAYAIKSFNFQRR